MLMFFYEFVILWIVQGKQFAFVNFCQSSFENNAAFKRCKADGSRWLVYGSSIVCLVSSSGEDSKILFWRQAHLIVSLKALLITHVYIKVHQRKKKTHTTRQMYHTLFPCVTRTSHPPTGTVSDRQNIYLNCQILYVSLREMYLNVHSHKIQANSD